MITSKMSNDPTFYVLVEEDIIKYKQHNQEKTLYHNRCLHVAGKEEKGNLILLLTFLLGSCVVSVLLLMIWSYVFIYPEIESLKGILFVNQVSLLIASMG